MESELGTREVAMARRAGIVSLFSIGSFLLMLGLQVVVASAFGAGVERDAYLVAMAVPGFVSLIVLVAIEKVFVPVFSECRTQEGKERAWAFAASLSTMVLAFLGGLAILSIMTAPLLIAVVAPGLGPEARQLAVDIGRPVFLTMLFGGANILLTGMYNVQGRFYVPVGMALLETTAAIAIVVLLSPRIGIFALAYGALSGTALRSLLLLGLLRQNLFASFPDLRHKATGKALRLATPLATWGVIGCAYVLVEPFLASQLSVGSLSYLGYARTFERALGIVASSFMVVLFPTMASLAAAQKKEEVVGLVSSGVRTLSLFYIPAIIGLMVLRVPVIRLIFERGTFGPQDTVNTALALLGFAGVMYSRALGAVFSTVYYSLQDMVTPVKVGVASTLVYLVSAFILTRYFSFVGLALAFSAGGIFSAVCDFVIIRRKLGRIDGRRMLASTVKIFLAATIMALSALLVMENLGRVLDLAKVHFQLVQIAGTVLAGILVYIIVALVFRVSELRSLRGILRTSKEG